MSMDQGMRMCMHALRLVGVVRESCEAPLYGACVMDRRGSVKGCAVLRGEAGGGGMTCEAVCLVEKHVSEMQSR